MLSLPVGSKAFYEQCLTKARAALLNQAGDTTVAINVEGNSFSFGSQSELQAFVSALEIRVAQLTARPKPYLSVENLGP